MLIRQLFASVINLSRCQLHPRSMRHGGGEAINQPLLFPLLNVSSTPPGLKYIAARLLS
jgi:hypothetical protein